MKKFVTILMGAIIMATTGCSGDADKSGTPYREIEVSRGEWQQIASRNSFAIDLLKESYNQGVSTDNVLVAPFSVTTGLSMLANGADGRALEELTSKLGVSSLDELNTLNEKLLNELTTLDNQVDFKSTNSIWGTPGFIFYEEFQSAVAKTFRAETKTADFGTQEGIDAVNRWCSDATAGKITRMIDKPDHEIKFALINALQFKGKWSAPFDQGKTVDDTFHAATGDCKVKMMSCQAEYGLVTDEAQYEIKYYGNSSFRMGFIKPAESIDISEFLKTFSIDKWNEVKKRVREHNGNLKLPRFSMQSNGSIMRTMKKLLPDALERCNWYTKIGAHGSGDFMISDILHGVSLEVNEEGAEAVAATVIEGMYIAVNGPVYGNYDMVLDRPFIFIIEQQNTGTILFAGIVNKL